MSKVRRGALDFYSLFSPSIWMLRLFWSVRPLPSLPSFNNDASKPLSYKLYHLSERNFGMRFMILLDDTYTETSMVCSFTVNTRALYRTKQERRLSNIQLNTLCNGISCWYSTTSVFTHLVKSEVKAWKLNDLQDLFLYIEGVFWCILQYRSSKNDFQPDISTYD